MSVMSPLVLFINSSGYNGLAFLNPMCYFHGGLNRRCAPSHPKDGSDNALFHSWNFCERIPLQLKVADNAFGYTLTHYQRTKRQRRQKQEIAIQGSDRVTKNMLII